MKAADDRYAELIEVIGEDGLIMLANEYAGTRLYVPAKMYLTHRIVEVIGVAKAKALAERFGPDVIQVPLARELRAQSYRSQGQGNKWIAVRLGLTETGVECIFKRLREQGVDVPLKGSGACHA